MPIILESRMMSSPVTRLNFPVTHLLKSWMGNIRMIGYLSQDPGLVSDDISRKKCIKIITNAVLYGVWEVSGVWKISISDSI